MTFSDLGVVGVKSDQDYDLTLGSTGLSPLDPMGDLQMLFTPGLHPSLSGISADEVMQEKIARLQKLKDKELEAAAKDLNQYLFDEAVWNVFQYNRRIWITNFDPNLPHTVSDISPWQFFVGLD